MDNDGGAAAALVAVLARGPVMAESAIEAAVLAALFPKRLEIQKPFENLRELPTTGGAFLICDAGDRVILLAAAEDVRHAVTRRLMVPEEKSRQADLSGIAARVYWRPTFSRFETAWAHWRAARVVHGGAYRRQLMFGPCWFLRVDVRDAAPRFQSVKEFRDDGATYLGPIMTRAAADEWIRMLESVFDLCRYHDVLAQSPNGQACSYFDMGRCPAPCNGTIPMEAYRTSVSEATAFSLGARTTRIEELREQMRVASTALSFERASGIKQILEQAERMVARPEYEHMTDVGSASWIGLQAAGPIRASRTKMMIRGCRVSRFGLRWSDAISVSEFAARGQEWWEGVRSMRAEAAADEREWSELVWLIAKFLFEGRRMPGLIFREGAIAECRDLAGLVVERFSRRIRDSGVKS
ncbi:MAG: hypothetical protein HZA51_02215 [Planctomycetes bacterium]|nr:hypothetical protein [Planctomycetota bacterium]